MSRTSRGALTACVACAALSTVSLATTVAASPPSPSLRLRVPAELATGLAVNATGSGATPGEAVRLERRTAVRWVPVARDRSDAAGRFAFQYRSPQPAARLVLRVATATARSARAVVHVRFVTLAAVGDVNLGDVPGAAIQRFGAAWPWTSVGGPLREADLAMANLECAISVRGAPVPKAFRFRGRPSSLRAAAVHGGLDIVNLANNHSGDYGVPAIIDTLRNSRRFGLTTVGAGFSQAGALTPRVVTRLGLRIAVVGFSAIEPAWFAATPTRPGTAWATASNVRRGVRAALKVGDIVVATFHWGVERDTQPTAEQRQLAALAIRVGAAAVIGAHPHVLQPIRRPRQGKLIAYSLGNFVFGAHSPGTERTGILSLRLSATGVASSTFRHATIVGGRPILR